MQLRRAQHQLANRHENKFCLPLVSLYNVQKLKNTGCQGNEAQVRNLSTAWASNDSSFRQGQVLTTLISAPPVPSNLNSRVHELCLALGCTRHTSFRLVSSQQDIAIPELAAKTSNIAIELSLPVEETALLASKEPRLLDIPTDQLSETLAVLCELLGGLTRTELSRLAVYSPFILSIHPAELKNHFSELATCLQVSTQQLAALVYQQPYMLTTPIIKVEKRFGQIAGILQLTMSQTLSLLAAYPPLAVEDPKLIASRFRDLQALLRADQQRVLDMIMKFPPILLTNPEITAARLQYLSDNLSVDASCLHPLLLASPSLFATPQNMLTAQFTKLFTYFSDQSRTEVLALVADNPALLGLQPRQVPPVQ